MRKIKKIANIALIFMSIGIFLSEGLAYPERAYTKLRVPINKETEKRVEKIYIDILVRHSSLGGSAINNELVFNLIGSEVKIPEVSKDENLRNLQLIVVKSTLDLGIGERRNIETLFVINTENGNIVSYDFVELSGLDMFSYSGKVFDPYRGNGYLTRAIELLLLSGRIKKWNSSYSLEEPAKKMYKRIRNDPRFFVEFVQPSRYTVKLAEASPQPSLASMGTLDNISDIRDCL